MAKIIPIDEHFNTSGGDEREFLGRRIWTDTTSWQRFSNWSRSGSATAWGA